MVNILFECPKCKVSQKENAKDVKTEKGIFKGQTIRFMYYDCPICGNRNIVQADNDKSLEMLAKCKSIIRVQMNANRQGRRGKQSGRAKKNQLHLRRIRNALQEELRNSGIHLVDYKISEE